MSRYNWVVGVFSAWILCRLLASPAAAQQLDDLYRVRDAVSQSYVEYHQVTVPKGKEVVLADLKGPGKVTYFYVTPVSDMVLKIFWDDESEPSVWRRWATSSGPCGARPSTTSLCPCKSSMAVTCVICRCRFPSVHGSSWPTTATRTTPPSMAYGIDYEQDQQYAAEKSRLHCMWRRSNPVPAARRRWTA